MKKIVVLIGLIVMLAVSVMPASAILNGSLDDNHTNVGAIVVRWPQYEDLIGRLCTATLIHPRALVTAAHCIQGLDVLNVPAEDVWITFKQDATNIGDPDSDDEYLHVSYWVYHPDYDNTSSPSFQSDIALVILEEDVPESISYQPLPNEGYMNGVIQKMKGKDQEAIQMLVVGYGTTVYMPVPDYTQDAYRQFGMVSFGNLLPLLISSYRDDSLDNASLCMGDSGGPLFHVDKHGNEMLVGLLAFGSSQTKCEIGRMIHLRLDTAEALDWIEYNLPPD